MRLPADPQRVTEVIASAAGSGITVFDTARAYGAMPGQNERLLAGALHATGHERTARIVTKGGMTRPGQAWVPDGRAKAIAADCEASAAALGGLAIDLYLLHAPDPRTPWRTSVRALARLADEGLVRRVGLANVTRNQLDEALELAPIAAVQVALSPLDDRALRAGLLERCAEFGLTLIAHSPLGGWRRAGTLARRRELTQVAEAHGATWAEAALAWLLELSPVVVPIPGATRAQSARSAARAVSLKLSTEEQAALAAAFGGARPTPRVRAVDAGRSAGGEIVIVMGIPGAGKTRLAAGYVGRGYLRFNRDERGGSLRALADELDEQIAAGLRRAVLDNTYLTRAARNRIVEAAARHSLAVRCVWLDTPLAQAQANLVVRLLKRFGSLPTPDQIRASARREPWLMLPTSQMRALRELEPPTLDEGFVAIERVPFARASVPGEHAGVFVGAAAVAHHGFDKALADADPAAPHLVFDWAPGGDASSRRAEAELIAHVVGGAVELAICPHAAGPPSCWCRPPLPGLPLAFAHANAIDLSSSILIGCSAAHRTLAATLGARYVGV